MNRTHCDVCDGVIDSWVEWGWYQKLALDGPRVNSFLELLNKARSWWISPVGKDEPKVPAAHVCKPCVIAFVSMVRNKTDPSGQDLIADAARYRWLVDHENGNGYFLEEASIAGHGPEKEKADLEIDKKMAEQDAEARRKE